jgi:hypothetical protein
VGKKAFKKQKENISVECREVRLKNMLHKYKTYMHF